MSELSTERAGDGDVKVGMDEENRSADDRISSAKHRLLEDVGQCNPQTCYFPRCLDNRIVPVSYFWSI